MVRSIWTESGISLPTLLRKSQSVRSGIALGSGLREGPAGALSGHLHASQRRRLEDLLAQNLGRLVFPLAALAGARFHVSLVTLVHVPSSALQRWLHGLRDGQEP